MSRSNPMPDISPLISVITVCYNSESTIGSTLQSVASQTFGGYEHLVIDGASKDNTVTLVRNLATPRTRMVSEPDKGIYDAMNKALGMARGEYIVFLNAGDTFKGSASLQLVADAIAAHDKPGIVYGQTMLVDGTGRVLGPRHLTAPATLTLQSFARGMVVCHQAFVVLKRLAPLYDTSYKYSADYDWCIRCLQHSRSNIYLDDTLIHYLSEGMTTAHHRASLKERFRIMSHYYGLWPTLWRHAGFALRFVRRRRKAVNNQ